MNIKVYNIYTCRVKENKNNKGEEFKKKSLLDPLEKVPSLQDYINKYVLTGALPPFNDAEIEDCESEEFGVTDIRGADVEDFKDYRDKVLNEYEYSLANKSFDKNVNLDNKKQDNIVNNKEKVENVSDSKLS